MFSTKKKQEKSFLIKAISLIFIVVLFLNCQINLCSARYLPTRSDESRKEIIKQLLKEIMDLPQQYDTENRFLNNKQRYGSIYNQDSSYLSKRSLSNQNLINHLSTKHN